MILSAANAPSEPKLFAAQTFRSKVRLLITRSVNNLTQCDDQITYDLDELAVQDRLALRDSLLTALNSHAATGPRVLIRQICLSLADLLLQLPEWDNAIPSLIDSLGKAPETASCLLEFLTVLAEEAADNARIDPTVRPHLTALRVRS